MPDWSRADAERRHEADDAEVNDGVQLVNWLDLFTKAHADRGELLRRDAEWAALVEGLRGALVGMMRHHRIGEHSHDIRCTIGTVGAYRKEWKPETGCTGCIAQAVLARPTPARGEEGKLTRPRGGDSK